MSAELRAMRSLGIPENDPRAFKREGRQIKAYFSTGGGSSAPTSQTVTTTSIPEYARPYVEDTLGRAQALTTQTPYQSYSEIGQRVAGFSPMQAQAFQNIASQQIAPQIADASNLAYSGGTQALGYGQQAAGYGNLGAQFGAQGAQFGAQGAQYGGLGVSTGLAGMRQTQQVAGQAGGEAQRYGAQAVGAGDRYTTMATSPEQMQQYMSPYMQNVVDIEKREAARQADILRQQNQARAVQQGAFGGSRSAIVEAELQRNLAQQMGDIQATGSQRAFEAARQAQQFGADLGLRGLQTGLQGVGQQIAAGQLGLAGTEAGLRGIGMGIEGARTGIEGARTGISGAQTGISGAQAGIGATQAATGAASALGQLGQTQFAQQAAINEAMMNAGAMQQARQQQMLDVDYQDFLARQQHPYQNLAFMQGVYGNMPLAQQMQSVYSNPNVLNQVIGAGTGAVGLYGMGRQAGIFKEGGEVKSKGGTGLAGLGLYNMAQKD